MHHGLRFLFASAGLAASCASVLSAQETPPEAPKAEKSTAAEHSHREDSDVASASAKESKVVTHHSITVAGKAIAYDATAGTLTFRDEQGKPIGSMFYVAYVVDSTPAGHRRPVTFCYNGGPGSSSLWLHLGSFGPVRVETSAPEPTPGPPFNVVTNSDTLLGKTDLVFLDAMGTGFSRALGETKEEKFYGVDSDIDAFAKAITRYLTINDRWNSPKFLFGESYGTTRTAGLVYALQKRNVQFNGVTILSSILNYGVRDSGFDQMYVGYLPTYAAAAWVNGKINPKPSDLPAFLAEVRAYASGPYLLALNKGQNLSESDTEAVAQKLSSFTGLSVTFLKENRLRVSLSRFRKELLRSDHRIIGRYDSRFLAIDADDAGENPEIDPASVYSGGPFVAAFHDYLSTQLNYHTEMEYRLRAGEAIRKWDWHHVPPGESEPDPIVNTALDLGTALRDNPHLQLLSLNGWYDMATPFFETEYDVTHMLLEPSIQKNIHFAYYPSGHMVYLNPQALTLMKADVAKFYDGAAPAGP